MEQIVKAVYETRLLQQNGWLRVATERRWWRGVVSIDPGQCVRAG